MPIYIWDMLWIRIAGILGFLGVATGAFGAHLLKSRLSADMLAIWHTAVLYHLLHAVALLALALYGRSSGVDVRWGAIAFTAGIAVFSGSLYALSLSGSQGPGCHHPPGRAGLPGRLGLGSLSACARA